MTVQGDVAKDDEQEDNHDNCLGDLTPCFSFVLKFFLFFGVVGSLADFVQPDLAKLAFFWAICVGSTYSLVNVFEVNVASIIETIDRDLWM